MILVIRAQKSFVCPDVPADKNKLEDAFEKAASGIKAPPIKKQARVHIPRGGMRGRSMKRY